MRKDQRIESCLKPPKALHCQLAIVTFCLVWMMQILEGIKLYYLETVGLVVSMVLILVMQCPSRQHAFPYVLG